MDTSRLIIGQYFTKRGNIVRSIYCIIVYNKVVLRHSTKNTFKTPTQKNDNFTKFYIVFTLIQKPDTLQNWNNSANLNEGKIMMNIIPLTANLGANHTVEKIIVSIFIFYKYSFVRSEIY